MKCIVEMDALGRFHVVYEPEPVKVEPVKVEPGKGFGTATKVDEIAAIWVAQSDVFWNVEDASFTFSDGGITVRVNGYQWKESSTLALEWLVKAVAKAAWNAGHTQGKSER